jgi:NDP-sugar pyrophosphorylase family protein
MKLVLFCGGLSIRMRWEIFDYTHDGEELVQEPFGRLINERKLMAYPYEGYWACMDTWKEKQGLHDVFGRAVRPGRCGINSADRWRRT